jgi:hypothetical protein
MQPSELFRRGVVAPCSLRAAEQLRVWDVEPSVEVEYLALPDSVFSPVWEAGLFASINKACSTLIDDYEEEVIEPRHLARVTELLRRAVRATPSEEVRNFLGDLMELCRRAEARGMPVYFIL